MRKYVRVRVRGLMCVCECAYFSVCLCLSLRMFISGCLFLGVIVVFLSGRLCLSPLVDSVCVSVSGSVCVRTCACACALVDC